MTNPTKNHKHEIFIIEDGALIIADLEAQLQDLGYVVCGKAVSGEEGVSLMKAQRPDLVIMDIALEIKKAGTGAAAVIRDEWGIPVVFLTTHADAHLLKQAGPGRPFGYLVRPFDKKDLKIAVEMAFHTAGADDGRRETEKRLQLSLDSAGAGVWIWNIKTGHVYWDDRMQMIFGYEPGTFDGTFEGWKSRVHPEDIAHAEAATLETVKSGGRYAFEYRVRGENEKWRWVFASAIVIKGPDAAPARMVGMAVDITDRKQAESEIRNHRVRLAEAQQIARLGSWEWRMAENRLSCSGETCRIFSINPQDFDATYEGFLAMVHPEDRDRIVQFAASLMDGSFDSPTPHRIEHRIILPDKTVRLVLERIRIHRDENGSITGAFGTVQEITERKIAEDSLKKSEDRLQSIIDNSTTVIYLKDIQGKYILVNKRYEELFHITHQEIKGKTDYDLFPKEVADAIGENDRLVLASEKPVEFEEVVPHDDGPHTYISIKFKVCDPSGVAYGVCGISTDITDRKRMEEALRESEHRFQTLSDASFESIFISEKGICLDQNLTAERMFGYTLSEAVGRPGTEWIIEAEREKVVNNMISDYEKPYEITALRKDGTTFPAEIQGRVIHHADRPLRMTALRDITDRKQAQQALKASEARYRLLAENASDVIWAMDLNLRYTYISPAVEKMRGYTPGEAMVQSIEEILTPASREVAAVEFAKALRLAEEAGENSLEGQYWTLELELTRKDETTFWAELRIGFLLNDKGRPIGLMGVTRDIDERKKAVELLKNEQDKFSFLVENASLSISLISPEGHYQYVNPKFVETFGYTIEELITGEAWFTKLFPDPAQRREAASIWAEAVQNSTQGELSPRTFTVACKNGEEKEIRFMPAILENGMQVVIYEDISESRRAERALIEAKNMAEAASRAKSEFLANMSHELRTPLNGVLGMFQLLEDSSLDEEQKEFVGTGLSSGRNLLKLLNDILDLSKIEAGLMELDEAVFVLRDLLGSVENIFKNQAAAKGINLHYGITDGVPPAFKGDSRRLRQILFNIVGNAIKFTEKGEVRLLVCSENEKGGAVRLIFTISDTGIGIPEKDIPNIFEEFTQLDGSSTRSAGGTGLGLAIVKRLLDMMKGKITVESRVGKGTRVQFMVPLGDAAPLGDFTEIADMKLPPKSRKSIHILLAEDNPANQLLAKRLLEKNGFQVTAVDSGRQVLIALENGSFDLILMDIQMPEMDGFETTRVIRESRSEKFDPNISIVAMTAHAIKGDEKSFLDSGMNGYISKPIDKNELLSRISKVLEKK